MPLLHQQSNTSHLTDETASSGLDYRQLLVLVTLWVITGVGLGVLSIPLLAMFTMYLQNQGRYLYVYILFFFTLILSDSRIYALSFAQNLKTVLMILLLLPFLFPKRGNLVLDLSKSFQKAIVPYILFSLYCIIYSPVPFTAFQKTLSYFLLFIIVPVLFYSLYKTYTTHFLKAIVYLGGAILIAGYIMFLANPALVMYNAGGRSSGALGNPNGLGMFCFLFFLLYYIIKYYFPQIVTKREHYVLLVLIFSSLLWSGSRGQTLAVLIFLVTQFLSKRNKTVGLLLSATIGIMLMSIEVDVVAIAQVLGFEDYLRVDTLDKAGGRVIAKEFAWEQIQNNFWVGRGFSFTEWIFAQHFYELSMKGHEGNAHNAFLTVWLDTGLIGLILFVVGWGILFLKAAKKSFLAFPVVFAIIASNMVESWLVASLNPFTIQVLMILTLLIYIVDDFSSVTSASATASVKPIGPLPQAVTSKR